MALLVCGERVMRRCIERRHYHIALAKHDGHSNMCLFDADSFYDSFMRNIRKQGKQGILLLKAEVGNRKIISMKSVAPNNRRLWIKGYNIEH